MKQINRTVGAAMCVMLVGVVGAPAVDAQMMVECFDDPVTANEIATFRRYVQTLTPGPDNIGNNWAQGHGGEQTKAMGLVCEISSNVAESNDPVLRRRLVGAE